MNICVLLAVAHLGANLLSAPKYPILFLRGFGLDVNCVVSRVITAGLGRRFRLVTLDDSRFPPVDVPAAERWLSRLGPPVIAVAVLAACAALLSRFSTAVDIGGNLVIETSNMMGYWAALIWALLVLALAHLCRMRRYSRCRIETQRQLQAFLYRVRQLGRWPFRLSLLTPQTIIARVGDSLWQQTVAAASAQIWAVLIDVSDPTGNLLWETEQLRRSFQKCVFIAERDHLWIWNDRGPDERTEIISSIITLIDNDAVLVYSAQSKLGGPAFRQSLRAALPLASSTAPEHQGSDRLPAFRWLRQVAKSSLYYGCLLLFVLISGIVVKSVVTQAVFQYNCPLCGR